MNHPAHITPLGLLERRLPHLAECRPPLHLAHRKLGTVSLKRISLLPPLNCEREISAFGPAIFVLEIAIGGKHNRKELLNRSQRDVCGEEESSRFWPRNSHRFCSIARKEGPTLYLHVCPVGRKITFLVATTKILPWPDCFVWVLHSAGRTTLLLIPPLLFLAVKFWGRRASNKTGSPFQIDDPFHHPNKQRANTPAPISCVCHDSF